MPRNFNEPNPRQPPATMQSAFPNWLRITWLCSLPFGLFFSARILWEKTALTWSHGPQAVGFSMIHTHPFFFMLGSLCCYLLMLWLIPSAFYLITLWQTAAMAANA